MEKTYQIEVDCANCAAKMEAAAAKTEGVCSVCVNYIMQKMTVTFCEGVDERRVMKAVFKNCRRVASDCEIVF